MSLNESEGGRENLERGCVNQNGFRVHLQVFKTIEFRESERMRVKLREAEQICVRLNESERD